ncbi:MAG: UDP-N-acetylglucosamine 1-carboxyvinyltransferase [bacterium]
MKFTIDGQHPLSGEIEVNGAKNAALKFMAASLLSKEPWTLKNVPEIQDVKMMLELLKELGVEIIHDQPHVYTLNAKDVKTSALPEEMSAKLRASILCVGPLLARFGEAIFSYPGGCILGKRPIDLFLDSYQALGAEYHEHNNKFTVKAKKGLSGNKFIFPWISHTVTESLILTAALSQGKTTIINAAMEPEVESLCQWLNSLGAKISNGGHHTVVIEGVDSIGGGETEIIPDRIETGTFAVLGSLASESLVIRKCQPKHLEVFWELLKRAGGEVKVTDDIVVVKRAKTLKALELRTREYPGFATDLQAPFTVLLTQAKGLSLVHEVIYEGRLFYTDTLNKMGAKIIMADPHRVVIEGPTPLVGKKMESPDIRAGIALVIAAIIAQGTSVIENASQIDRGYEKIDDRLKSLGAKIHRDD